MIDHIGVSVRDYTRSKEFYLAALAPLGYAVVMEFDGAVGLGEGGKPDLWIAAGGEVDKPTHIALRARDRKAVDAFYQAALAAGGKDNGAPGLRAHYHPSYYGAFVIDPDGNNLEAVCHTPE
ncbi:MAG TPA: VOC family protein [Haliangium sp.]|nr:VOC family protein [Haliangium sp.]